MALSQSRLRELLHYNPRTGVFTWRVDDFQSRGGYRGIGAVAGVKSDGRIRIRIDGKLHHASRLAILYVTGRWPRRTVDHANGNCTDNRWRNLREATQTQQNANQGLRSNNSSGIKGVCLCQQTGRYIAQLNVQGRKVWLGRHDTPEQAHAAYIAAARKHFGEFARAH